MLTLRTATTDVESQSLLMRRDDAEEWLKNHTSNATRKSGLCGADASARLALPPSRDYSLCKTSSTTKQTLGASVPQGISSTARAGTCSSTAIALLVSKHRNRLVVDITYASNVCDIPIARLNDN